MRFSERLGLMKPETVRALHVKGLDYKVIYSHNHYKAVDPAVIADDTTGLFMETGSFMNYLKDPTDTFKTARDFYKFEPIFNILKELRKPIFFGDVHHGNGKGAAITAFETLAAVTETVGGAYLLWGATIEPSAFAVAVGLWAGSSLFLRAAPEGLRAPQGLKNALERGDDLIHPERSFLTVSVRNVVLAHKWGWLAEHYGEAPDMIVGYGHKDVEGELQKDPKARIDFLKRTKVVWGPVTTPESLFTIQRFDAKGRKDWRATQKLVVPDLQAIA